jgi:hypothetical protein
MRLEFSFLFLDLLGVFNVIFVFFLSGKMHVSTLGSSVWLALISILMDAQIYPHGRILARATCMRCHGTKCPLLIAFFSSLHVVLTLKKK